jgi:signal transduction histidine kinase
MEFFQMIGQQLNRGKKLIRNLRNLSDLEEYDIHLAPMEMFSTLRSVINFTRISFPKKVINVKVISNYKKLYILANELLNEVFENIITNSINYNRNKTVEIEIIVSTIYIHHNNYVKIEFKDNGIGIDDSRKEIIFQGTPLKNRHTKGMGIGLSLVAKLIEIYSGDIWVENRIKGDSTKGSNFIILIPLVKKKR